MDPMNSEGCCAYCEGYFRDGDPVYLADMAYGNDRPEVVYLCCLTCRDSYFQAQDEYLYNGVREVWFIGV